ncbi:MAG TPA: TIGR02302 family protein [Stellaceae bacterium]|nr:TIGR02302 family protein [Stellaceae bacterium]
MPETTSRPATPPLQMGRHPISGLKLRLRLARAALFWERSWPEFATALGVVGVFAAAALFDLPAMVPGWLHAAGLAVLALLFAAALWRAIRAARVPETSEGRRRLETASGLDHRPLTALTDRLAGGASDPVAVALWAAHRARMAGRVRKLRIGMPLAGLLRRDPFGLRVVLTMALLVGVLDAGGDTGDRLLRALVPDLSFTPGAAEVTSLDIWVTPPDYTGEPPLFLQRNAAIKDPIAIPTGSTVLAQVQGGREPPRIEVGGKASDFARIDSKNFKGSATLTEGDKLEVTQSGRTLGSWPIRIIPNEPPTISFASPPQKTTHNAVRLEYRATDAYGVDSAKAVIRRVGGNDDETLELDLPLPGLHLKEAHDSSFYDLTPHPWAGLPVQIHLEARNTPGLVGKSEEVTFTLPERIFHNPFARALIEQRRELTVHPQDRDVVSETLSDLSQQPGFFEDDKVVFLGLRIASLRLRHEDPKTAIPTVQGLLWDLALRLEDGHETMAQRDLRDLMQQLQNALANNAPDDEIERLTKQLKDAIDRYLKALAENMQKQNPDGKEMQPIDPSRLMTDRDLQRMLDRARDLARSGAKDAARDLLSQLQNMLENLRTAQPRQMLGQGNEAMRDLQQLMNREQQLLDRTYRQSRQAQRGQPRPGNGDAAEQEAIRRRLGEVMRELGDQGQDAPQSLGRADRSMGDASQALERGAPGEAVGPETDALDALQQATKEIIDQMTSAFGGTGDSGLPDGMLPNADRDPLGRPTGDSAEGTYSDGRLRMGESKDDSFGTERAKQILDELRRRSGDTGRPETEREYIERLLQRF